MPISNRSERPVAIGATSRRVVVELRRDVELPYTDDIGSDLDFHAPGFWRRLGERHPGIRMRRMFTTVAPERLLELVTLARGAPPSGDATVDLTRCFFLDARDARQAAELAAVLERRTDLVALAYVDPPSADANARSGDECVAASDHLAAAPRGIDAAFAASLAGGRGEGQHFVDVEAGWHLDHASLRAYGLRAPLAGAIKRDARDHGTAVLGVVTGIVPHIASLHVASVWHTGPGRDRQFRQDALIAAIDLLCRLGSDGRASGVLLLEQVIHYDALVPHRGTQVERRWDLPLETAAVEFELIRLASALGITVVEAAGNGFSPGLGAARQGIDLDDYPRTRGMRASRDGDSGALLVAAASSDDRSRLPASNFGSRVDCYAWGDGVATAGSCAFGNTSAAAAIVAGAALAALGIAAAAQPARPALTGREVRTLLRTTGTRAASSRERIGVMPDLRAAAKRLIAP
jgi:serine protease